MATDYKAQYFSISDSVFLGRVTAAGVQAAIAIYAVEAAGTLRRTLCTRVMANPDSYARQFAWAVVSDPTLDASSTDAALFARINAQWNVLAGV